MTVTVTPLASGAGVGVAGDPPFPDGLHPATTKTNTTSARFIDATLSPSLAARSPVTIEHVSVRSRFALRCLPLIVAATSACSGGGGRSGGNGLQGTEVEPNDDISIATDLGGAGTHEVSGHTCSGDQVGIDDFVVTASSAGNVTLTLEWDETNPDDDLGVALLDADGIPVDEADVPPVSLSAPVVSTAGEIVYVEIGCYGAFDPVPYSGTITVP